MRRVVLELLLTRPPGNGPQPDVYRTPQTPTLLTEILCPICTSPAPETPLFFELHPGVLYTGKYQRPPRCPLSPFVGNLEVSRRGVTFILPIRKFFPVPFYPFPQHFHFY